MSIALTRSGTVTGAVLARATASDNSDEMLVKRIAAGDKLAMQVLFARHRTPVYRWLLRFVGNETVAERPSERRVLRRVAAGWPL